MSHGLLAVDNIGAFEDSFTFAINRSLYLKRIANIEYLQDNFLCPAIMNKIGQKRDRLECIK